MREAWDNFMGRAGFFVTIAVCLVVAGISGYFLLADREKTPPEEPPVIQTEVSAPVTDLPAEAPEEEPAPVAETIIPVPVEEEPAPMPEAEIDDTPVIAEAPQLVVSPLNGEVLTVFSMDALVYSETLGDWRTHNGVDISAKPGATVQAACAGTVLSVENDALMGTTVTIEHRDGYETTYANLQAVPTVEAGDSVTAGQIIGAVGTTAAAESAQNPHLHFSVTQDVIPVNPTEFMEK